MVLYQRQWIRLTSDGTIAAVHTFVDGYTPSFLGAVDVTELMPVDFTGIRVDPSLLPEYETAKAAMVQAQEAYAMQRRAVIVALETALKVKA